MKLEKKYRLFVIYVTYGRVYINNTSRKIGYEAFQSVAGLNVFKKRTQTEIGSRRSLQFVLVSDELHEMFTARRDRRSKISYNNLITIRNIETVSVILKYVHANRIEQKRHVECVKNRITITYGREKRVK